MWPRLYSNYNHLLVPANKITVVLPNERHSSILVGVYLTGFEVGQIL